MQQTIVPQPPTSSLERRVQHRLATSSSRFVMPSRFPPTSPPSSANRRTRNSSGGSSRGDVTEFRFIHSPRASGGVTVIGKGSVGLGAEADTAVASSADAKMRQWVTSKQRQRDAEKARLAHVRREEEETSKRNRFTPSSRMSSPRSRSGAREINSIPAIALSSSPQRVKEFIRRQEVAGATRKEQALWSTRRKEEAEAQQAYIRTMHGKEIGEVRQPSPRRRARCSSPAADYVAKERNDLLIMKAAWSQEAKERSDQEYQLLLQKHHDVAKGHCNVFRSREEDHQRRAQCVQELHASKAARDEVRHGLNEGHADVIRKMKKRNVEENTDKKLKAREERDATILRIVNGERIESDQRLGTLAEREAQRSALVHGMVQRARPTPASVESPSSETVEDRSALVDSLPTISP